MPEPGLPVREAGEKIRTPPLVRRIAAEHNVDLTLVPGTGLGGRVSKKDILTYLEHPRAAGTAPQPATSKPAAPPAAARPRETKPRAGWSLRRKARAPASPPRERLRSIQ